MPALRGQTSLVPITNLPFCPSSCPHPCLSDLLPSLWRPPQIDLPALGPSPVQALDSIPARRAGLLAGWALVTWLAGAVPVGGIAMAVLAGTGLLTLGPPPASPADAVSCVLVTSRVMTSTSKAAASAPPAWLALAGPSHLVTAGGVGAALAGLAARGRPPAWLTAAGSGQGVTVPVETTRT